MYLNSFVAIKLTVNLNHRYACDYKSINSGAYAKVAKAYYAIDTCYPYDSNKQRLAYCTFT